MKNWKAESSLYWKTSRKIILKTGLSIADMLYNFSKAAIVGHQARAAVDLELALHDYRGPDVLANA
jgi:hypothetical protein